MSDILGLAPKALRLSYKLSSSAQKLPNEQVSSEEEFKDMKASAYVGLMNEKSITKGKNQKGKGKAATEKQYRVFIMQEGADIKGEKKKEKKGTAKNLGEKRKRTTTNDEDSDSSTGKQEQPKVNWHSRLEEKFKCATGGHKYCFIHRSGVHEPLNIKDLGLWAIMIVSRFAYLLSCSHNVIGTWKGPRGYGKHSH